MIHACHRNLAVLLKTGKNRVKRIMRKYGLAARRKRKKYFYPGKPTQTAPNLVRELEAGSEQAVVFSDIFEVHLANHARLRSCFTLCKRTHQILGMAFDYHMRNDLVTIVIDTLLFQTEGAIWHRDQGKQYGALQTRQLLVQKGHMQSMSRAVPDR
jgi:putative transposase